MSLIEIEWHPTDRQLRVFGVSGLLASIAGAFVLSFVWGVATLWAIIVLAAGAAIFLCSLTSPAVTRILYLGLTLVGMPIGLVVSFLLLAAFYFLLLTPLALVFKIIGRDPLCRSWRGRPALGKRRQGRDALATSYWVPHKSNDDPERYFHQF
jgi:hypothetical protein